MESMATYYFQMALSYANIVLQCFMYVGVGILAFRVAGPAIKALKTYASRNPQAATPVVLPELSETTPVVASESTESTLSE